MLPLVWAQTKATGRVVFDTPHRRMTCKRQVRLIESQGTDPPTVGSRRAERSGSALLRSCARCSVNEYAADRATSCTGRTAPRAMLGFDTPYVTYPLV